VGGGLGRDLTRGRSGIARRGACCLAAARGEGGQQ
jgi:hypothetical protein